VSHRHRGNLLAAAAIAVTAAAVAATALHLARPHRGTSGQQRAQTVRSTAPRPAPTPSTVPTPTATPTPPPPPVTATHTLGAGGVTRQWVQVTPGGGVTATTPILVFLHGRSVTPQEEIQRDGLLPLVAQGRAELVYPTGIGKSWNAGGCCSTAAAQNVDDVGFIRALIPQVDPVRIRPVFLVGYSNGGRLAYTLACQDPGLVDGFAIVDAMPLRACNSARPISILQIDGTADNEIPYKPGDSGAETPATTQVAALRARDGCTAAPVSVRTGALTVATWSGCRDGTRVVFATYQGGTHAWPVGDTTTPSGAMTIWSFVSGGQPW